MTEEASSTVTDTTRRKGRGGRAKRREEARADGYKRRQGE